MKKLMFAAALAVSTIPAFAADVGVSVSIGQPGFYGHIDIGDYYPRPRLIYAEPRIIVRGAVLEPIYMHVPPGHAKNWRRYCGRYEACGRPVYFVQDTWYNDVYVPRYRERHGGDHYHGDRHDHDRDHDRGDRHEDRGGHDDKGHGNGNGHGKGHGKGRD